VCSSEFGRVILNADFRSYIESEGNPQCIAVKQSIFIKVKFVL